MKLQLLGSKITRINAKRNPDFLGKVTLDTNIKINSIEKFNPENSKIDSLKIDAIFQINYGDLGEVEIGGQFFLSTDNENTEKIIKTFEEKRLDTQEHLAIINLIMQKFSIKAFEIEEELSLPIHIRLPSLSKKEE